MKRGVSRNECHKYWYYKSIDTNMNTDKNNQGTSWEKDGKRNTCRTKEVCKVFQTAEVRGKQDIQLGTPHVIAVVRIDFLLGTASRPTLRG